MSRPDVERAWSQEPDRIPTRGSLLVMAGASAIVVASVLGSWAFLTPWRAEHPDATSIAGFALRTRAATGPAAIGGIRQTLIEGAGESPRVARQRARLASYGWVDRAHGVVHVPIERAMELVLAEQAGAPGAPADAAGKTFASHERGPDTGAGDDDHAAEARRRGARGAEPSP